MSKAISTLVDDSEQLGSLKGVVQGRSAELRWEKRIFIKR
jgi:hypothetical protein